MEKDYPWCPILGLVHALHDNFSHQICLSNLLLLFIVKNFTNHICLYFLCLNSILLHSGLNPAWHFWLSTRFFCCLKMKSVENNFTDFRENIWNCSRKYPKMFKTDSFLGNKKMSFNQNVWCDHATMQQDVLLHFWVIFLQCTEVGFSCFLSTFLYKHIKANEAHF